MKPFRLSDDLAALVGTDRLARPTCTKLLWVYIKAHSLQKPGDGRIVIPDEKLATVLGKAEITSFAMAKKLR